MLLDIFSQIYDTFYALIVSIPVDSALGALYVILDTIAKLALSLLGFSGSGISLFSSVF